jgi:hypothetical protein
VTASGRWIERENGWLNPEGGGQEEEPPAPAAEPPAPAVPVVRAVLWVSVKCPGCGSKNCPVTSTRHAPLRWHKCRECGMCFKSLEG